VAIPSPEKHVSEGLKLELSLFLVGLVVARTLKEVGIMKDASSTLYVGAKHSRLFLHQPPHSILQVNIMSA
jgi:hypothetical protein